MRASKTKSSASKKAERTHPARQKAKNRQHLAWAAVAVGVAAALAFVVLQRDDRVDTGAPVVGGNLHSLVTSDGTTFYVGGHGAVAMSRDGGVTWGPVPSLDNADAMGWAFIDDAVVVGGHPGLAVSTDGGITFVQRNGGLPNTDVHALGGTDTVLYAASPGAGFMASDDAGATWTVRNPQVGQGFMGRILVDPADAQHAIAPDMQAGAVETLDGGATWRAPGGVPGAMWVSWDPSDVQNVVVSGFGTAAATTDGGSTWNDLTLPAGGAVVEMDPADPRHLFAASLEGSNARIWRSTDEGRTWAEL